jgi:predicted RNase H-like nuclease (RuvC/YqgF family)
MVRMEETKETLQRKVDALNRQYIAAMKNEPEGPEKNERLRRLQDAINEYEKRIKSF